MKVIYGLKELEIWYVTFLYGLLRLLMHGVDHTFKKHGPRETFFRSTRDVCKTCQFIFLLRNTNFQVIPFQSIAITQSFSSAIFRAPQISKGCLGHDRNVHKILPVLCLTIMCIKPFTCKNTTLSVPFLNEMLFLH